MAVTLFMIILRLTLLTHMLKINKEKKRKQKIVRIHKRTQAKK
jgi:hypothetical protein